MISLTKTEMIIEDEDEIESQEDLEWWIARCEYFKDRCDDLEKENIELKKKLKKRLTSIF